MIMIPLAELAYNNSSFEEHLSWVHSERLRVDFVDMLQCGKYIPSTMDMNVYICFLKQKRLF